MDFLNFEEGQILRLTAASAIHVSERGGIKKIKDLSSIKGVSSVPCRIVKVEDKKLVLQLGRWIYLYDRQPIFEGFDKRLDFRITSTMLYKEKGKYYQLHEKEDRSEFFMFYSNYNASLPSWREHKTPSQSEDDYKARFIDHIWEQEKNRLLAPRFRLADLKHYVEHRMSFKQIKDQLNIRFETEFEILSLGSHTQETSTWKEYTFRTLNVYKFLASFFKEKILCSISSCRWVSLMTPFIQKKNTCVLCHELISQYYRSLLGETNHHCAVFKPQARSNFYVPILDLLGLKLGATWDSTDGMLAIDFSKISLAS